MSTTDDLERVLIDLEAEGNHLDGMIGRAGVDLSDPTPAQGWTIGHQIGHLHWTDRMSVLACLDPSGFARQAEALGSDPQATINAGAAREAARRQVDLIASWRVGRAELLTALSKLPPDARIPWFGPSTTATGLAVTRMMETWAHGVDVVDALGLTIVPTSRLRYIADLGIETRDFAFALHGRRNPGSAFRVELSAPDGGKWTWGPAGSPSRITGSALDFCLLVTQRRHRNDLRLRASAGSADQWLDIAQVFPGPAGTGRSAHSHTTIRSHAAAS